MHVKINAEAISSDSYGNKVGCWLSWPQQESMQDVFLELSEKFKNTKPGAKFTIEVLEED